MRYLWADRILLAATILIGVFIVLALVMLIWWVVLVDPAGPNMHGCEIAKGSAWRLM